MHILLVGLVFLIGILQPIQATMNAGFRDHVGGDPFRAAMLNMLVGAAIITLIVLLRGTAPPGLAAFRTAPMWTWFGGFIGATLVTVMLVAAPKLGVGLLVSVFIAGQVASSLTIDHFGWLGIAQRAATPGRLLGLGLIVVGVILVQRSTVHGDAGPPAGDEAAVSEVAGRGGPEPATGPSGGPGATAALRSSSEEGGRPA